YPPGVPVYRISVNVQRFESWPGKRAAVDAVWSVRALGTPALMTCRTSVAEPVADGYDALVVGHRRALAELASQITGGVEAMEASRIRFTKATASGQSRAANVSLASTVPCLNLPR
ncbi:ABC-type transport auxiliary lipoprotein family protein, partial [Burkholderia cepacia]|uniref:ABC-type transport auxiliary lipoprotein family protein n=1 Tax=Burkholderia cepacia TaxID=292 RepID=UPI002ABD5ADF